MITTPEIICDLFSFLDKDQIERIQLVNQFWNNVIIIHKNILPLRQLKSLEFMYNDNYYIKIYTTEDNDDCYKIKFDGTNLSKSEESDQGMGQPLIGEWIWTYHYSQLTADEVLKNLNDVVFYEIEIGIENCNPEDHLDDLLNLIKLVTTKTGGRFRGRCGYWKNGRFDLKLGEIFDNYIIVDQLTLEEERVYPDYDDSYIREVCANPEIVQLPSTPKEVRLTSLRFNENEEVLNFTCNGKLNGANRVTIQFETSYTNYGNFIRQWFELYRTHENPISLVGKFEPFHTFPARDAVKTFLNNTQLRVKYSLETIEFHRHFYSLTNQYIKRSCVLHETASYALVIEMEYGEVTDMSSINASDLDQPPYNIMESILFCVKSL